MSSEQAAAVLAFRARPKFRCTEPQFRILNPSPSSVTAPLEQAINACASALAQMLERGASQQELKAEIKRSLYSVAKPFDTEDKEYFAYYYSELGDLVGVKVGPILSGWLYGFPLALLLRLFSRG